MIPNQSESYPPNRSIRAGSTTSHDGSVDSSSQHSPQSKDNTEGGGYTRGQTPRSDGTPRPNTQFGASVSNSAGHQQKYVQAAFVQKLYNMLDDTSNRHSIRWSDTGDSFIVNPGPDFQNVLATYFKHTNPQSFVRQLNMYGFHKVNDVFQGNTPDTHLWEFKHGEGNFKRGDLSGLSEIKRRPSKPAISHRESVAVPMHPPSGPPMSMVGGGPDHLDARLGFLEQQFYETHMRLARMEEAHTQLNVKCQMLMDALGKCQKTSREMTNMFMGLVPNREHPIHRDAINLQSEIDQQMSVVRSLENNNNNTVQLPQPLDRRMSTASSHLDGSGTVSPFQNTLYEESSRLSAARQNIFRNPHLTRSAAGSPRRQPRSFSRGVMTPPPSSIQEQSMSQLSLPALAAASQSQPTSAGVSAAANSYLARRHTSADIRDSPGWPPGYNSSDNLALPNINRGILDSSAGNRSTTDLRSSPYASSGNNSTGWPSPRMQPRQSQNEQQIRESLGRYQIDSRNPSTASDATITQALGEAAQSSDAMQTGTGSGFGFGPPSGTFGAIPEGGIWGGSSSTTAGGGGIISAPSARPLFNRDVWASQGQGPGSGASTRRSSMAHLLNPAEVAEEDEGDDGGDVAPDERKRKRLA